MEKLKKLKAIIPVLGTVCVVLLFHFSKIYALKFYPVIVNSFIFCVFFSSVFCEETIIQKIAKKMDGELTDFSRNYTRKLTYVWCIFLFVNLSISFATVFMSPKIWELYNACISYIALGVMFGVEYIVRIILRAKYDRK
ncbi:TPA: DNA gyrase subunit B [Candidatus Gastranaerophilales bacterium HUM_2]|nr:MAG TPA: DNA gyrase subunit B [Candidatus Gastranaerophilales bacterium HUM_2]